MASQTSEEWNKYLASGVKVPIGGRIPDRQWISGSDFSAEVKYLYFEGLKRFQAADKDDPLSFYQIAGIHGLPFTKWPNKDWNNDIPQKPTDPTGQDWFGGFCTHSSILFLTWHRPYLALFESALHSHVKQVAGEISSSDPKKEAYMQAAENFRIPYWDWAREGVPIVPPDALDPKTPLYAFTFPDGTTDDIRMVGKDGSAYRTTVRYPDPQSPDDTILANMTAFFNDPASKFRGLPALIPERNLTERTAYVLFAYHTYPAVSSNRMRRDKNGNIVADAANWGSLEDIHNAVHNLTGGIGDPKDPNGFGGHMSNVPVSSFDPIFWLHHTNIDRLFAIWQALHQGETGENTFVVERQAGWGSFTVPINGDENAETPLYPFRPNKDSWYKSNDVRAVTDFGYTYPELHDKKALLDKLGEIYVPIWKSIQQSKNHIQTAGEHILPQVHTLQKIEIEGKPATAAQLKSVVAEMPPAKELLQTSLGDSKPFLRDLAPGNRYLEWITNISAEKHALGGAYTVHVFLGDPAEPNVALWPVAPSHVGTFAPLGQPSTTKCAKCLDDQREQIQVTGQIPLTVALVERYLAGIIPDLSEESVKPYLIQNLHWRVAKLDGTIVEDRSAVTNLTVFVVSNEVTLPTDESQLPAFAQDVKIYPEITTARNGVGRGEGTGLTADGMAA